MATDSNSLIQVSLLLLRGFREDLKAFLTSDASVLKVVAQLGRGPNGYEPLSQAPELSKRTGMPAPTARQVLRVAGYLYDRLSEQQLELATSMRELTDLASEDGIDLDEGRRQAVEEILAYNEGYEKGRGARKTVTAHEPHLVSFEGSWGLRLHRTRKDYVVKVPAIGLTFTWHDPAGSPHTAYFVMDDEGWFDFQREVERLSEARKVLGDLTG